MGLELPSIVESALSDGPLLLEADRLARAGLADRRASFQVGVGELPVDVGFVVVAGVHTLLERLPPSTVQREALAEAGQVLGLSPATVARLEGPRFSIDVDAMPDGTLAFGGEAILTLEGPLFEVLIAASVSLPWIRRATSVATQAARLAIAADGDTLVERASSAEIDRAQAGLVARAAFLGGCDATANPVVAALLDLPLRAAPSLAVGEPRAPSAGAGDPDGWASLPPEVWHELSRGDEEAALVEARRLGHRPTGWWIPSFARPELPLTCGLVAVEEDGAWRPGVAGGPGRTIAVRYFDARGHLLRDVVHLAGERLREASGLEAATLEPLARPLMRQGRAVAEPEPAWEGRARARAGRHLAPPEALRLHRPAAYRVELSEGARKATSPPARGRGRGPS